jgi:hypothetical protein
MMRSPHHRRPVALIAGAVALVGTSVIAAVGSDTGPTLESADTARAWLETADAAEVGVVVVKAGVVLGAAYLLVTTGLAVALRRDRCPRLTRATERVTLSPIVRLARRSAGVGLTATVVVSAGPIGTGPSPTDRPPASDPSDAPTMVVLDDPDSRADDDSHSTATQRRIGGSDTGATDPADAPPPPIATDPAVWTIEPGEHLWAVAAETLRDRWSTTPSHAATARYLATLIDANRDVLADPDNPDLVYPGQLFVLPPVPAGPATSQPW